MKKTLAQKRGLKIQELSELLTAVGVCPICKKEIDHEIDEPFSNCECFSGCTGEWSSLPLPLISVLRRRIAILEKALQPVQHDCSWMGESARLALEKSSGLAKYELKL